MRKGTTHTATRHDRSRRSSLVLVLLVVVAPCVQPAWADAAAAGPAVPDRGAALAGDRGDAVEEGLVSWYGAAFHNRLTASGERFDADAYTMAHPSLPFGTRVRVTNLRNGRSVVVRVNDRGPVVGRRIADLSQAAASVIGMLRRGIVRARLEVLGEEAVARN